MSSAQPYQVAYAGAAKALVRELYSDAAKAGIVMRISKSLREVEGHLELHPTDWGDPFRHLHYAKITVYRRVHDQLNIEYGVHTIEPLVWVSLVEPVLGHPLCKK